MSSLEFAGSLDVAWFFPHQPVVQVGGKAVCACRAL